MDTFFRMFKTCQQAILTVLIIHLMNLIDKNTSCLLGLL